MHQPGQQAMQLFVICAELLALKAIFLFMVIAVEPFVLSYFLIPSYEALLA